MLRGLDVRVLLQNSVLFYLPVKFLGVLGGDGLGPLITKEATKRMRCAGLKRSLTSCHFKR